MAGETFEITKGDSRSSVVLHVPHSSREIPDDVRRDLLLDDVALTVELDEMTDSRTDLLAIRAATQSQIKPWIFQNVLSRLVVDPERFPDDREAMNEIGMGAVYQKNSRGEQLRNPDSERDIKLLARYFHPYAAALERLVKEVLDSRGFVTIIDVHSYRINEHANSINKGQKRPPLCLGVDSFHTPQWLIDSAEESFARLGELVINQPYSGTYVPISMYEQEPRITSVMMENREDNLFPENFDATVDSLAELIDAIQVRHNS